MAAAILQPTLESMWQSSPTFRRQCRRLAGASDLRVTLSLEDLGRRPSHRAKAAFKHLNGRLVAVDVQVTTLDAAVELVAHEIEHIIEQLDGADLERHVRAGAVRKHEDGSFETLRATTVGRRVAREMGLPAAVPEPIPAPHQPSWTPLHALVQQEAFATGHESPSGRVSADGRFVVFASRARLSPADNNSSRDIYVFDLSTRQATLETPGLNGKPANGESFNPDISGNGRYVVFESAAGNLTNIDLPTGTPRVYWRDRELGITRLLSTAPGGEPANGISRAPAISGDGGTVVFTSSATNLLEDEKTKGGIGIYRIELATSQRWRVDVTSDGRGHAGQSASPAISGNGQFIAFASDADLTTGDTPPCREQSRDANRMFDVYIRDAFSHRTRRVSIGSSCRDADGPSSNPAISADGRHVAFVSEASNLTSASSLSGAQIFVRDMETGAIEMVSRTPAGRPGNARSTSPAISNDGLVIAYQSLASNLLCESRCASTDRDINLIWDVYVYDRGARRTTRASVDPTDEWMESSRGPSLDQTGRVLTFASAHSRSIDDEEHDEDLFVVESSRNALTTAFAHDAATGLAASSTTRPSRLPR
jgi:Tol biopolymer transport system component